TSVRGVYAWRRPLPQVWQHLSPELRTPTAMNSLARQLLDEVVDESLVDGDPHVDRVIIEGPSAECLAEVARGAELLVVGTRHHLGLGSVVIGSVSAECVLRARCPVVAVHGDE